LGIIILRFHTLGLYIHNDTVVAFGQPEKQILFEPLFAEHSSLLQVQFMNLMCYYHHQLVQQQLLVIKWLPGWLEALMW
jgi:photosystem I P700 chlorophyll a apoprotein A2